MDKLQWFKFIPTDWVMGKIQKCPEVTQARYMRLICLYWNKECVLTIEDAEIEIDKEHLDILIAKKVVKVAGIYLKINFLDDQYLEVCRTSEKRRDAVKQRWEREKQNGTDEVQNDTNVLQVDTSVLQNDTDKSKRESKREKREREERYIREIPVFDEFLVYAKEKEPSICPTGLKLKYESWVENGWKDGNNSKIGNWKSKLLNTIPYLPKIPTKNHIKTGSVTDVFKQMRGSIS